MKRVIPVCLIFIFALIQQIRAQEKGLETLVQKGTVLEKIADGFQFTEGPSAGPNGDVYFTDQPNDRIMVWSEKIGISVYMEPSGRSNGMCFDNQGFLWSCADEKNEIWKIGPGKEIERITGIFNGKAFNGPNDLWADPSGGVYFTDPFYKRTWWDHTDMPQAKQCVYYLKPDHKTVILVADDLSQPNGIAGTRDGKVLFVADIRGNKTWKYNINADGTLANKTLFCEMGSDGMALDSKGNVYLTGKGVTIFDKTGTKLGNIPVPESWTANVCFGSKDMKSLYVTASKGLYRIRMKVKGAH
jgi:gluconolactonase